MHKGHGKYTAYTAVGLASTASVNIFVTVVVRALVAPFLGLLASVAMCMCLTVFLCVAMNNL